MSSVYQRPICTMLDVYNERLEQQNLGFYRPFIDWIEPLKFEHIQKAFLSALR